jgi:DNA-binding transcriptional LysR family regulator
LGEISWEGRFLIDKLELLLALAKERHFERAAEACGVTQPTMSTSLKQLEEILGVMLVQRGSRFQGFTPEGERALDWARRIVGDARAMRQEINALNDLRQCRNQRRQRIALRNHQADAVGHLGGRP